MNDQAWELTLRMAEKELGHPLSASERALFDSWRPEVESLTAKAHRKTESEQARRAALLAFVKKLMDRQGRTMPDFEALYRRKAELDGESS